MSGYGRNPGRYPGWLDTFPLDQFTNTITRVRSRVPVSAGSCGALPAVAFAHRYPAGCVLSAGHGGYHAVLTERERAALDVVGVASHTRWWGVG